MTKVYDINLDTRSVKPQGSRIQTPLLAFLKKNNIENIRSRDTLATIDLSAQNDAIEEGIVYLDHTGDKIFFIYKLPAKMQHLDADGFLDQSTKTPCPETYLYVNLFLDSDGELEVTNIDMGLNTLIHPYTNVQHYYASKTDVRAQPFPDLAKHYFKLCIGEYFEEFEGIEYPDAKSAVNNIILSLPDFLYNEGNDDLMPLGHNRLFDAIQKVHVMEDQGFEMRDDILLSYNMIENLEDYIEIPFEDIYDEETDDYISVPEPGYQDYENSGSIWDLPDDELSSLTNQAFEELVDEADNNGYIESYIRATRDFIENSYTHSSIKDIDAFFDALELAVNEVKVTWNDIILLEQLNEHFYISV